MGHYNFTLHCWICSPVHILDYMSLILPDNVTSATTCPQCPSMPALSMEMQARQV